MHRQGDKAPRTSLVARREGYEFKEEDERRLRHAPRSQRTLFDPAQPVSRFPRSPAGDMSWSGSETFEGDLPPAERLRSPTPPGGGKGMKGARGNERGKGGKADAYRGLGKKGDAKGKGAKSGKGWLRLNGSQRRRLKKEVKKHVKEREAKRAARGASAQAASPNAD